MNALSFYRMETDEISERYIAPCFVNGLEAFDGVCHQTFRAARFDVLRTAESDSDDEKDYENCVELYNECGSSQRASDALAKSDRLPLMMIVATTTRTINGGAYGTMALRIRKRGRMRQKRIRSLVPWQKNDSS
ncbi:hypothetical protein Tco_0007840 [Tanacetum coccineum]